MKIGLTLLVLSLVPLSGAAFSQIPIAPGTVLPAQLGSSLDSRKTKSGERVRARIMQDVPLSSGGKIRAGAKVIGHVVSVKEGRAGQRAELTLRFDRLEFRHQTVHVSTNLRALAAMMEVEDAQVPSTGPDRGTPWAWRTRNLIGGEVAYGEGGPVAHGTDIVGEALADEVLVRVKPNPSAGCRGEIAGNIEPQALWVFSSDACGVYGIPGLEITHAGRSAPVGEIVLVSLRGNFNIRSGSGILLRITGVNSEQGPDSTNSGR